MKPTSLQLTFGLCATAVILLNACTTATPNLDNALGKNLSTLKAMQIMYPTAAANPRAATLDGQAAREVLIRYHDSYKAPTPQPNVFTIGVGGK